MGIERYKITDALWRDFARSLACYREHGDLNPLHYFDSKGFPALQDLVKDSDIRLVPGAMLTTALYGFLRNNAVYEETPLGPLNFVVGRPVLYTQTEEGARVLRDPGENAGMKHGQVRVQDLGGECLDFSLEQLQASLYDKIGALWTENSPKLETGEGGVVPVVQNITVGGMLPDRTKKRYERGGMLVEPYDFGEIAIGLVPLEMFKDELRPYFCLEPMLRL